MADKKVLPTDKVFVTNTNDTAKILQSSDGDKVHVQPRSRVAVMRKFTTKMPIGVKLSV